MRFNAFNARRQIFKQVLHVNLPWSVSRSSSECACSVVLCKTRSVPLGIGMKRFSETEKWRDPWFQALPHTSKLLFLYFCDTCNNAGFYEENIREACFHLGIDEAQYQGALQGLTRGIKGASGWLWIRRFLRHQKNESLSLNNPAHKQIIRLVGEQVERFKGFPEFREFLDPVKGLLRPIGTGTGTGKRKRESPEREKIAVEIYEQYPRKVARPEAIRAICSAIDRGTPAEVLLERTKAYAKIRGQQSNGFTPHPSTWFNQDRFNDDPSTWDPKVVVMPVNFSDRKKRKERIQLELNAQFISAKKDPQGKPLYTKEEQEERERLRAEMESL